MKQTFKINGMSCGSCKQTVEKTLQAVNGVTSAQVSLNPSDTIIRISDSIV
ncbi:MAG: cation transporter [Lutibacter sp.]|nr:cation transporter [Lutibacter sp.]MDP3945482.1 cation transporter [Lutibacter sp.]